MGKIDMLVLFKGLQEAMQSKLSLARSVNTHNGEMGEAAEEKWRKFLRKYLPQRYKVDKAMIVDHTGSVSDQIDIVIYDAQYSYFIFEHENIKYIPSEAVYAVIEVKQSINKRYINYACEKAYSVRKLIRTSAPIYTAGGVLDPKEPPRIFAGIIALESEWKDPLGVNLINSLTNKDELHIIDFGCTLKHGSFWLNDTQNLDIVKSVPEEGLMFFFLELLRHLQTLATVPAIEIDKYEKALRSFSE